MTQNYQWLRRCLSLNRIQAAIVPSRTIWKTKKFSCPSCSQDLPPLDLAKGLDHQCPACRAELVVGFKHQWLCPLISVTGGLTAAHFQRVDGCQYLVSASVYAFVLLILCSCILLPWFPTKVELARDFIQKLRTD